MYKIGQKAILCSNHPNSQKDFEMTESAVTIYNKKDPEKPLPFAEYLTCHRCFQTVQITPELRIQLDALKNDGLITLPTKDILDAAQQVQAELAKSRSDTGNSNRIRDWPSSQSAGGGAGQSTGQSSSNPS